MTYRIPIQITTKAPVLLTRIVASTYILNTDEYIPGSAIRGMLASRYITKHALGQDAHKDSGFYKFFLSESVQFGNCYFVLKNDDNRYTCYPMPRSVVEEKNSKIIHDLFHEEVESGIPTQQIESRYGYIDIGTIYAGSVKKSLHFHHARDKETNIPKEGDFFNYEAIQPEQVFRGSIIGSKDELETLLKNYDDQFTAYLGRSKNAQYGKVLFEFLTNEPEEFFAETEDAPTDEATLGNGYVSLTFLSDTIIYDDYGFSTPSINILQDKLQAKIEKAYVKTGYTENYVSIWNLRKPSDRCFLAGSCFLVEVTNANKAHLLALQKSGLGERCNEGFGRFVLDWQYAGASYSLKKTKPVKIDKPKGAMPNLTMKILKTTLLNHIHQTIELQAWRDAKLFNEGHNSVLPSKSLLSRLELQRQQGKQKPDLFYFSKPSANPLDSLGNHATGQLNRCRKNLPYPITMFNFLKTLELDTKTLTKYLNDNKRSEIIEFAQGNEIGIALNNQELQVELYHKYLQTLFSAMRRLQKIYANKNGGNQ